MMDFRKIKEKKWWFAGLFAILFVLLFITLFWERNIISQYMGGNRLGGILLAVELPLPEKKFHFVAIYFHMKNGEKIGYTYLPDRLTLPNGQSLHTSYVENPARTMRIINDMLHTQLVFYRTLQSKEIENLINWAGGLFLYRQNLERKKPSVELLDGAGYLSFWQAVLQSNEVVPGMDATISRYLREQKFYANLLSALLRRLSDNPGVWNEQTAQSLVQKIFIGQSEGNIKKTEIVSLAQFYFGKLLLLENQFLPLAIRDNKFELRHSGQIKKLSQDFVARLSQKAGNFSGVKGEKWKKIAEAVKIQVLNGSGIYRQAKILRNQLSENDFNVVHFANLEDGILDRSVFMIRGFHPAIAEVMRRMSIQMKMEPLVVYNLDFDNLFDISFIIGKDFFIHD